MVRRWFHHGDVISGQVDLHMTKVREAMILYNVYNIY